MKIKRGEAERLTSALGKWWENEHTIDKRLGAAYWRVHRIEGVYSRVVILHGDSSVTTTIDGKPAPVTLADLQSLVDDVKRQSQEMYRRLENIIFDEPTHHENVLTQKERLLARVREIVLDDGVGAGLRMRYLVELLK